VEKYLKMFEKVSGIFWKGFLMFYMEIRGDLFYTAKLSGIF